MIKRMLLLLFLALVMCVPALYSQDFDISEFSDPHKYGWIDEETRLAARDSLFLNTVLIDDYNEQMQSPILNAVKTAIAPGWGHFSVGSYTKGQVFLASQLVLLGTSIYYREQAMIDYRKYENATHIDDINGYYDSAITPYRQSNLLLGLFFVVWGYTIYDAVLETNEYNDNLWRSVRGNHFTQRIVLTPTSISVRF